MLVFLFSFLQNYLFLIANVRKILNMNLSRFTPTVFLIWFIMNSSTLILIPKKHSKVMDPKTSNLIFLYHLDLFHGFQPMTQ
jgi:hypothetical protein